MKVFLARHSFAGPAAAANDPEGERTRGLTDLGVGMAAAVAKELRARGKLGDPLPSVIFSSNFTRAVETADIFGAVLGIRVNVVDDMAPNRPLDARILELMSHDDLRRVMLVGHHDNTTPVMNTFGGSMGKYERPGDDDLRVALGYKDGSTPGDGGDDADGDGDWVPLVMAEVRRLRIDRRTGEWKVRDRLTPSDVGFKDIATAKGQ